MADELVTFAHQMDQCWIDYRFNDLINYLDEDATIQGPIPSLRAEGLEDAAATYRGFMNRATLHRFHTAHHKVSKDGDTATITQDWTMSWDERGSSHKAQGQETLQLVRGTLGWRVTSRAPTTS